MITAIMNSNFFVLSSFKKRLKKIMEEWTFMFYSTVIGGEMCGFLILAFFFEFSFVFLFCLMFNLNKKEVV